MNIDPAIKFLRNLLILGRVSNLPTVWTNVIVGWLIGGGIFGWEMASLLGGVSLIYIAGMTLNDAFDAQWDRENAPQRPIPSGSISLRTTWVVGTLEMIAGCLVLLTAGNTDWKYLSGLVIAVLLYNWIHKKWSGSVLIMGACRAFVYLLAWDAARADMRLDPTSPLVFLISGGILLYISGLTLAARSEHQATEGKPPSWLSRLLLLLPTSFPVMTLYCENTLDISRPLLFGGIIVSSVWIVLFRSMLRKRSIPQGISMAIAGIALYDATVALLLDWRAGIACLLCFGITLVAQRFIPAT